MAKKGSFSKVYDKNGDYADVEAVRFDGTRTVQMQGDVTASQTWNGDPASPLTLNTSIGAKKVTQDKIGDKAVGTGQMADGSVGLTQMAASAMTDTVSANNSKLVTSQGVNAAIAAATLNRGKDYGPMSVDDINAISETIPTGSTVYVEHLGAGDAKVINDGYSDGTMASFSVEVGEDLKYYRSPDNSLHGWYSTEANVKIKQPANYSGGIAVDSAQDASSGSAGIEFIQSFKQNTNGDIRDIVKAQVDIVDSTSSTRTNAAATPNSVKSAYDLANTANTGLANKLDKTGDGKDVTVSFSEASARANIGTGEKLSVMFGKIKKWFTDLKALAFKDTVSNSDISGTISDSHIASASTWNGKADKVSGATNGNLAALDSNGNLTDSGKKASDFEQVANKVSAWQGTPDNTHYPSEKLVKDGLDAKADLHKVVAIADAVVSCGEAPVSDKWFKVAELASPITTLADNAIGLWNITFYRSTKTILTTAIINVRNNADVLIAKASILSEDNEILNEFDAKVVVRGLYNNRSCELWLSSSKNSGYFGFSVSEIQSGNYTVGYKVKYKWSYHDYYGSESGSAEPQSDVSNNVVAEKLVKLLRQKNIESPTNDNLVAMDASGLVKDSGKKATDFVQSVKIGSGSELKDASGNVSLPVDSTPTAGSPNLMTSGDINNSLNQKPFIRGVTTSSGSGYFKMATLTYTDFSQIYSGAVFGILTRGGSQTTEGLISVSFSEYTTGNETGSIVGNVTILNSRSRFVVSTMETKFEFYIVRPENGKYELYINKKESSNLASITLLNVSRGARVTLYSSQTAEANLPTSIESLKLPIHRKTFFTSETSIGSESIPAYVDDMGELKACTDTFVNNIAYVANQSGGGGNLNKTINGTTTSVLAFMNDSEAVAIWADAKAAAANAS